jgi:putative transposase
LVFIEGRKKQHHLPTIRHIPDDLWNEVKNILPAEKPIETIGRPIVLFRKVLDGILLYVLRTGCQWNMLPKEYGSGSTHVIEGFRSGLVKERVFEKLWIRLLEICDDIRGGIEWEWMAVATRQCFC